MGRYLATRVLHGILVIFGVSVVVFLLTHLTGDPVTLMLPLDASHEQVEQMRHEMGFDRPLLAQYGSFLGRALQGDFGQSLRHAEGALDLVIERLPATVELTVAALGISLLTAIPLGVLSAVKRRSGFDYLATGFSLLGQSMPSFWIGFMLIFIFAVRLEWLPASGRDGWQTLILPALTLAAYSTANIARMLRGSLIETLRQDFMRTAKAKGLNGRVVVFRHGLRNAMVPVLTIIGLQTGSLLGGAVVTENVFSWPGIGRFVIQAIQNRDFPSVQAAVFVLSMLIVAINIVVDCAYSLVDPRIRYA
ncbi:MAG: ABC transporter permease [Bacillota bacterium]